MARTKRSRFAAQGSAAAKRAAAKAQEKADAMAAEAARLAEAEAARSKSVEARLDVVEELYEMLGVDPEPKREQVRIRAGEPQTMLVDRDPREEARTAALLSLVEKLAAAVGQGLGHYRAEVERERRNARDEADAARAARSAKKAAADAAAAAVPAAYAVDNPSVQ